MFHGQAKLVELLRIFYSKLLLVVYSSSNKISIPYFFETRVVIFPKQIILALNKIGFESKQLH